MGSEVRLLHCDNAEDMSNEELEELLNYPVITDAQTIMLLNKRGFKLPVNAEPINTLALSERFTDHIVNKGVEGRRWAGQFCDSNSYEILADNNEKIEILSEYVKVVSPSAPDDECISMANYGIRKFKSANKTANAIFTTPKGAKWAVFGFDMWSRTISNEKRNIYLNVAEYISGHRQPAEIVTPVKAILQSRVNDEGELTQVSVTNITVAEAREVRLMINNPVSYKAVFMGQYAEKTKLKLLPTEAEGVFEVSIPCLKPWAVGTVFFE